MNSLNNFILMLVSFILHIWHFLMVGSKKFQMFFNALKISTLFLTFCVVCFCFIFKELIIFNEEILVFISFTSFIYFMFIELKNLFYLELVSRNEKIFRAADLNLYYHQQILNAILNLYKIVLFIQNNLKNEYIFFRNVFFFNLWPCKGLNYINANLQVIEKNFNIISNDQYNIYQDLQVAKTDYDYEVLKLLSISYMYN